MVVVVVFVFSGSNGSSSRRSIDKSNCCRLRLAVYDGSSGEVTF